MTNTQVQQEIIATNGNLVVMASAGAGKTAVMVKKIVADIDLNTTHKVVAAITFTNKAAKEIKDRLLVDTSQCFIGTNNSFAVNEIILPFIKDAFGSNFDVKIKTDFSKKFLSFEKGLEMISCDGVLGSYVDTTKNFVFELALSIVRRSFVCAQYLKSRYFKLYIDEYQDCDKAMHDFFMYLCDDLHIEMFAVGDTKQSIYTWRGADPYVLLSLSREHKFNEIHMLDSFRSCQQIQDYSNLLFQETRDLYKGTDSLDSIIWLESDSDTWAKSSIKFLLPEKSTAVLRGSNKMAEFSAKSLNQEGASFTVVTRLPIGDISTDSAWLYLALAKYLIVKGSSVYDIASDSPFDIYNSLEIVQTHLDEISKLRNDSQKFDIAVEELFKCLGYDTSKQDILKLFKTVNNNKYFAAFSLSDLQNVAMTIHLSKGLEFDQVILFASDFNLRKKNDVYKHYVAITRAKSRVIIVKFNKDEDSHFETVLEEKFKLKNLSIDNLVKRFR